MPKPTNTQELTARFLAGGAGFKPEEQFFALLNAASHVAKGLDSESEAFKKSEDSVTQFFRNLGSGSFMEPLADDKAPF